MCASVRAQDLLLGNSFAPGFGNADITAEGNQSNRRHRCRESEDQPHGAGTSRALFRAERGQNPAARADKQFADKKRNVSQRTIGCFLPFRRDRGGVFIDARRIERFAHGEDGEVKCRHHVVGMDASFYSEITVPEPLAKTAIRRRLEPAGWQRHNEHARGADYAAHDYHSIRSDTLSERTDHGNEEDDDPAVNVRELSDRRVQPQLAIAEFWEDVIDLQKDRFEESDQEKENQNAREGRLADQPSEKLNGLGRA